LHLPTRLADCVTSPAGTGIISPTMCNLQVYVHETGVAKAVRQRDHSRDHTETQER
jgi:hypothetical protein